MADENLTHKPNPSKLSSRTLKRVAVLTVLLVILPLCRSQAPDFFNKTLFTRSWELVHLVVVGIAVAYGLFSRPNNVGEKEISSKIDSVQSYISGLLHASTLYDEEAVVRNESDENNVQHAWNSQYFREEPMIVTALENPNLDKADCASSSGFQDASFEEESEHKVLPSPIPWRSRSWRMVSREEVHVEDLSRKKRIQSCIPPPPPPPPQPITRNYASRRSNSDTQMISLGKMSGITRRSREIKGLPGEIKAPEDLAGQFTLVSDDDDEEDGHGGRKGSGDLPQNLDVDPAPDVDKKAEEFIAKFREQIRLQRAVSAMKSVPTK